MGWLCSFERSSVRGRLFYYAFKRQWYRIRLKLHLVILYKKQTPVYNHQHLRQFTFKNIWWLNKNVKQLEIPASLHWKAKATVPHEELTLHNYCLGGIHILIKMMMRTHELHKFLHQGWKDYNRHRSLIFGSNTEINDHICHPVGAQ